MFDSHAHLNFNTFKEDAKQLIESCLDKNIRIINVGSQYDTSLRAVEMANSYDKGVYATIGIHPIHLSQTEVDEEEMCFKSREEKFNKEKYEELLNKETTPIRLSLRAGSNPSLLRRGINCTPPLQGGARGGKVVAIGEIGLDYFHIPDNINFEMVKKIQKQEFIKQLEFACDNNLPVILHCRGAKYDPYGAYNEMIEILKKRRVKGVIHCFSANLEIARKFLDLGFHIGFTGIITFKNVSLELVEVVKKIPLDKILVETDCPYLAPMPYRGERCIPEYVEYTLRKVAELKDLSFEEAERQTDKNVEGLFNI